MSERVRIGPFRGAEATLVPAITALSARAMAHPWNAAQVREAFVGADTRCVLIEQGDVDAPSVGALRGFVLGRAPADGLLEIDQVAVDPAHRRRGLGRTLVTTFLEAFAAPARSGAPAECHLELAVSNEAAHGLYAAVGFVVVGRRPRYYPGGEDALLLTWSAPPAVGEGRTAAADASDPSD